MTASRGPGSELFYRPRGRARLDSRRSRRRRAAISVGLIALTGGVFFLGVALGRALESAPRPGGTQTVVRTLEPGTLPAVTRTVTVTPTAP